MDLSVLPYKLEDALKTSATTPERSATVVTSGEADWEARGRVGGKLTFHCAIFLYMVYSEYQAGFGELEHGTQERQP